MWELKSINQKAPVRAHRVQRPIVDEGARTRPDPWPRLGIITIKLDIYLRSASTLEGK